jgi:hypothetical protein
MICPNFVGALYISGTRIGVRVARCLVRAVGWSRWGLLGFCWVCSGCLWVLLVSLGLLWVHLGALSYTLCIIGWCPL